MTDRTSCAELDQGPPQVRVEALAELVELLQALRSEPIGNGPAGANVESFDGDEGTKPNAAQAGPENEVNPADSRRAPGGFEQGTGGIAVGGGAHPERSARTEVDS